MEVEALADVSVQQGRVESAQVGLLYSPTDDWRERFADVALFAPLRVREAR